jgi:predicted PurR-regulated permease PerM
LSDKFAASIENSDLVRQLASRQKCACENTGHWWRGGVLHLAMVPVSLMNQPSCTAKRVSYWFMLGILILVISLHLATPLLAAWFAYLALSRLHFFKRWGKWFAVTLFLVLLAGLAYGLGYVLNQIVRTLPEIAERAVLAVIAWAKAYHIELPFTDFDSLKDFAVDTTKSEVYYLGSAVRFARGAATEFVLLVAGCVVAISIFLNPDFELPGAVRENPYSRCCREISKQFAVLYRSFVTVMGAQITISAINTILTGIFVLAVQLPYGVVVLGATFLCGLLPVVGNLISNTIVVGIGFTVSPRIALAALVFLVIIHKLEYFLNSKIVGWRISNPLWLTLLGLVVGERLLGIPGMILAPVVLNYIKVEASGSPENVPERSHGPERSAQAAGP